MKEILISSFDMEVGGVERSLISLLENFNYKKFNVDLMLYRHCGDFMKLLPNRHNLLSEVDEYASFRKSIGQLFKEVKSSLKGYKGLKVVEIKSQSGENITITI